MTKQCNDPVFDIDCPNWVDLFQESYTKREEDIQWFADAEPQLRTPLSVIRYEERQCSALQAENIQSTPCVKQRKRAKKQSKSKKLSFDSSSDDEITEMLREHNKKIQEKAGYKTLAQNHTKTTSTSSKRMSQNITCSVSSKLTRKSVRIMPRISRSVHSSSEKFTQSEINSPVEHGNVYNVDITVRDISSSDDEISQMLRLHNQKIQQKLEDLKSENGEMKDDYKPGKSLPRRSHVPVPLNNHRNIGNHGNKLSKTLTNGPMKSNKENIPSHNIEQNSTDKLSQIQCPVSNTSSEPVVSGSRVSRRSFVPLGSIKSNKKCAEVCLNTRTEVTKRPETVIKNKQFISGNVVSGSSQSKAGKTSSTRNFTKRLIPATSNKTSAKSTNNDSVGNSRHNVKNSTNIRNITSKQSYGTNDVGTKITNKKVSAKVSTKQPICSTKSSDKNSSISTDLSDTQVSQGHKPNKKQFSRQHPTIHNKTETFNINKDILALIKDNDEDDLDNFIREKLRAHNAKIGAKSAYRVPGNAAHTAHVRSSRNHTVSVHIKSPCKPKINPKADKASTGT